MSAISEPKSSWRAWLDDPAPKSQRQARLGEISRVAGKLVANPLASIGLAIVCALVLAALFAPWLARGQSPIGQDLADRLAAPSAAHWFGADELGRDIYARIMFGARVTLMIVALVAAIVAPIGLAVGVSAGYFGGLVDVVLMRVTDIFLAFPRLILALAFAAALGPGIANAVIAISLTSWPPYARIARA